jgi:hypothetical protein
LNNYEIIDIEIQNKLNIGFHSIFLQKWLFVNSLIK